MPGRLVQGLGFRVCALRFRVKDSMLSVPKGFYRKEVLWGLSACGCIVLGYLDDSESANSAPKT